MLVGAQYLYFITTIEIKVYWMNAWMNIIKADDHQIQCYACLVAQSRLTLCNPMDCSPPGSFVHGISQARILEWVAICFSRKSSSPRDPTHVSCVSYIASRFFPCWAIREAHQIETRSQNFHCETFRNCYWDWRHWGTQKPPTLTKDINYTKSDLLRKAFQVQRKAFGLPNKNSFAICQLCFPEGYWNRDLGILWRCSG